MIITQVRETLKSLEVATESRLAAELATGRGEVAAALEFWVRRGDVRRCEAIGGPVCGSSCTRCPIGRKAARGSVSQTATGRTDGSAAVVYEWISS